jgi:hypothetical protein
MEWFSQKTSIAGIQISNWILVLVAIIVIWIIYSYLALGRQNHERGRRLRWLADSCSAANDVHRLQRFTRYWSLVARASRRIRTYPRHDPWEAMTLGNPHARQQLAMSLRRHFVTFRARPDSLCVRD